MYICYCSWKGLYCYSWKGITCHSLTSHEVRVDLRKFGYQELSAVVRNSRSQIFPTLFQLQPPLSIHSHLFPSIHTLTHLSFIGCGLTGRISRLEHLGLAYVNLTRDVVESVASLPNLTSLAMSEKSGTPLSPLGNLTLLSHLELVGSDFTLQPFPIWISNLTSLVSLYLFDYNLSSSIPSSVLSLPHLSNLVLYGNPSLKVNLSSIVQHAS
ncbi:hypothetical protein SUGI_0214630 [Cryptomeria japonica]|nr:hypothetical protein SUGI_0214630 [Cryptomeria japonica]